MQLKSGRNSDGPNNFQLFCVRQWVRQIQPDTARRLGRNKPPVNN